MMKHRMLFLVGALLAPLMFLPQPVEACYHYCVPTGCGGDYWHGSGPWSSAGAAQGVCSLGDCTWCAPELVSDRAPVAEVVIESLKRAEARDLKVIVEEFGDVLLVSQARGMVVILGGCDAAIPMGFVRLDEAQLNGLVRLGVQSLEGHMDRMSAITTD